MANLVAKILSVLAFLMCLVGASLFSNELSNTIVELIDGESSKNGERYMIAVFIFTTLITIVGTFASKTCFFIISCMLFAADLIEGISFGEVDAVRWLLVNGNDQIIPGFNYFGAFGKTESEMQKLAGGGVMMIFAVCISILSQAFVNRDKNHPIHILARVMAFVGIAVTWVGCIILWSDDDIKYVPPPPIGSGNPMHDHLLDITGVGIVVTYLGVVGFASNQFDTVLGATAAAAYLGIPLLGRVLAVNDDLSDDPNDTYDRKKILGGSVLVWLGCLVQCIAGGFVLHNPNRDYSLA